MCLLIITNLLRLICRSLESRGDVKPKEGIEKREEKGRTRKNRGRTGDTHGQARSCVAGRMAEMG